MIKLLKKLLNMPNEAKATIAFIVASFILKGIAFITTPVFTRVMDAGQYGIIATYNSWLSIIEVFALLGLTSAGVFNVGLNDYRDRREQYVSSVLTLCNCVTVVVFVIIFIAKRIFGEAFLLPNNLLILMFLWLLFNPAQIFWVTRQRYEFKYKLAFCVTVFSAIISQIVSLIVVLNSNGENLGEIKLWSTNIVNVICILPIYLYIFAKGRKLFEFSIWKQVLTFALPLIPHYLAQHIMSGADRIMISEMVSSADAGIYSVVANVSMIATMVWTSVNASLIPFTFENMNKKNYKDISGISTMLILFYAVGCIAVSLIAPEVIKILAPEEYSGGIYAVPPIAGVAFMSALYNIYANIEFYHKKSTYIAVSTIVATIVNIILNAILIPKFTFYAAAYTTLISYAVLVLMHFVGYKKCQQENIYDNSKILLITIACVIMCILCSFLYPFTIFRYGIICLILVVMILKRNSIILAIKKMKK